MPETPSGQAGHGPPGPGAPPAPGSVTHQYDLRERAAFIRAETVRLIDIAKTGHYTSVFSAAEILAALYYRVMRIRRGEPDWPERDRLVLSKGHVAVGVYPVLADLGFFDPALLDTYTRLGNPLGDHPDMRHVPGADFSSGSLGHGLSVALGMALAARVTGLAQVRVYALLGDGECNEGQIWEAAMAAAHHRAGNLFGVLDRNQMSLDGPTEEVMSIEPLAGKWRAFGWEVREVDGHDPDAVAAALLDPEAAAVARPHLLICHTVKGKGVSFMEGGREWHLGYLAPADRDRALAELAKAAGQ